MLFKPKNPTMYKLLNISRKIERERKRLVELGMSKGFQNPQVIKKSQEVDELLVEYYKLEKKLNSKTKTTKIFC